MMKIIRFILNYISYIITSKTCHAVHGPFIFQFIRNVIRNSEHKHVFTQIENLRKDLCKSKKTIKILDFGAGSNINNSNKRKIKDIARNSAKNKKFGKLLYNTVRYFNPNNIIELGTSLGVSTCYIAKGRSDSTVYSFEGCPETIKIAKENLENLKINNVKIIEGDFNTTLDKELKKINEIDFAFIDGNHKEKSTINYYEKLLKYSKNSTVFIFDDINWSKGMQRAWNRIKKHPKTSVTIDLFFLGIVFIRRELSKENFKIRF